MHLKPARQKHNVAAQRALPNYPSIATSDGLTFPRQSAPRKPPSLLRRKSAAVNIASTPRPRRAAPLAGERQDPRAAARGRQRQRGRAASAAGYANLERLPGALDGRAMREALKGVHLLGIRSRTQITAEVLEAADRLIAVGCFNVGTNQVDLDAAANIGVPVFNAPFSNTRSVAELVIGEIVMLLRRIVPRSIAAHQGGWDKSAIDSHEVRGKTLGIIGYGNIGSQLSYLAEAMGMRVIFYDHTDKLRHGNTEPTATLQELLARATS